MTPKQTADYTEALHRIMSSRVLMPFFEVIDPRLFEARAGTSEMDAEMMVIIEDRVSNLLANMICSIGLTATNGNLMRATPLVRGILQTVDSHTKEIWRRMRDGDTEGVTTKTFQDGKEVPFDFRDHIGGGRLG